IEAVCHSAGNRSAKHPAPDNLSASKVVNHALAGKRRLAGNTLSFGRVNFLVGYKFLIEVQLIVDEVDDPLAITETGCQSLVRGTNNFVARQAGRVKPL